MAKTWKELEAEGVKRCCACFVGGGRCRRRADGSNFCKKHGPQIAATIDKLNAPLKKLGLI